MPAGGLRSRPGVGFARVTETNGPQYEVWRAGREQERQKEAIRQSAAVGRIRDVPSATYPFVRTLRIEQQAKTSKRGSSSAAA